MGVLAKLVGAAGAVGIGGFAYYATAGAEQQFWLISSMGPAFRLLDPETTHNLGIEAAKWGLFPKETRPDPAILRTRVWAKDFPNPIGLAAGFDKHAEAVEPLMKLGFGFVEIGSVTPRPQPGNPSPRVFRIKDLSATINRYGFNSLGADAVQDNLTLFAKKAREDPAAKPGLLGVNLGKNKSSKDAATDYSIGLTKLSQHADYVVINISSPNTPGLRALQGKKELEALVSQVKGTRDRMRWGPSGPPPLVVKIAPDLTQEDKEDIAAVALKYKLDGLIVSNTTITRPGAVAQYPEGKEAGGLSGPPLMDLATDVLADMYRLTGKGKIPLIGCGGVSNGEDAYRKIRAGASLVQLYTALAYAGPGVVPTIKAELARLLERDGFESVAAAVGVDHQPGKRYENAGPQEGSRGTWWKQGS
uniref:Dihydroorotate dehydrogenase (quinone), mitochondrial n=1 Tax=Dunaliella tertiolecta TaxID=3047 RepID=A0A7S3QMM7_DUNTE